MTQPSHIKITWGKMFFYFFIFTDILEICDWQTVDGLTTIAASHGSNLCLRSLFSCRLWDSVPRSSREQAAGTVSLHPFYFKKQHFCLD